LRLKFPSLTHEEYEEADEQKLIFWKGLMSIIAEEEEKRMNKGKVKNKGHT
jgi:hypothetical protein